ncbi:hypothetical protein D3C76_1107200 [compost metagenome]
MFVDFDLRRQAVGQAFDVARRLQQPVPTTTVNGSTIKRCTQPLFEVARVEEACLGANRLQRLQGLLDSVEVRRLVHGKVVAVIAEFAVDSQFGDALADLNAGRNANPRSNLIGRKSRGADQLAGPRQLMADHKARVARRSTLGNPLAVKQSNTLRRKTAGQGMRCRKAGDATADDQPVDLLPAFEPRPHSRFASQGDPATVVVHCLSLLHNQCAGVIGNNPLMRRLHL